MWHLNDIYDLYSFLMYFNKLILKNLDFQTIQDNEKEI